MFSSFLFRSSISSAISSEPPSKSSQASSYSFILYSISWSFCYRSFSCGSSWFNSSFKCSSRSLSKELKFLSFLRLEVQLILCILLNWSFAFLRSSQLFNHFRLWPVITLWSWHVTNKTTTSLFFCCWISNNSVLTFLLRLPSISFMAQVSFSSKFFSFNSFNPFRGLYRVFIKYHFIFSSSCSIHSMFSRCAA